MIVRSEAVDFVRRYTRGDLQQALILGRRGRVVARCDCEYEHCSGWQMAFPGDDVDGVAVADLLDELGVYSGSNASP